MVAMAPRAVGGGGGEFLLLSPAAACLLLSRQAEGEGEGGGRRDLLDEVRLLSLSFPLVSVLRDCLLH